MNLYENLKTPNNHIRDFINQRMIIVENATLISINGTSLISMYTFNIGVHRNSKPSNCNLSPSIVIVFVSNPCGQPHNIYNQKGIGTNLVDENHFV